MKVTVFHDERVLAKTLAAQIASALAAKPDLVLGLPTGRTPIRLYHELGAIYAKGQVDFSRATTFNLDEFLGIPPEHPGSYRAFMQEHLFSRINVPADRINVLNGAAADPAGECARYESAIAAAGGIDLQILGIGTNGHIGFNEPADGLCAHTHVAELEPESREANAQRFGGDWRQVPERALSMGMATILNAREIVLMATGEEKADAVHGMIEGLITTQLPASILQVHPRVTVMLDRAAARRL
jgi:glucosamine-6-phosphate deaminase